MDGLDSTSDFNFLLSFFQFLRTASCTPTIIGIKVTFMFYSFFKLSGKVKVFVCFFFFVILASISPKSQNPLDDKYFFLCL